MMMKTDHFSETMWTAGRAGKTLAFGLLAMIFALLLLLGLQAEKPAYAATTFTVNSTGDEPDANLNDNPNVCDTDTSTVGSQCTLRAAIEEANNTTGLDAIKFNIPGAGPHIISPTLALPPITDPVTIDGYSQPGAKPNTLAVGSDAVLEIELSGASIASSASGLNINAANSTVKGLVVNRFSSVGISVCCENTTGVKIEGNYIGTDVTGTTDKNGTQDLGNSSGGVDIAFGTPNTTIGGTKAGARNVISGNDGGGVYVSGPGNRVQGNYIGTDKDGAANLGNSNAGVSVSGPNNTIGGTKAGARNVISGNTNTGVLISGTVFESIAGNKVQGNYVGTDATGTQDLGNSVAGVFLQAVFNTTIGGTVAGAGNVISGNDYGVLIAQTDAAGNNQVQGNRIGTKATGTEALGNAFDGVRIDDAPNNTIGGATARARNVISGNNGTGVAILGSKSTGNKVSNSTFSNGRLGIDLGDDGSTPDDNGDGDTGANNLQNFPNLTSATTSGSTTITGTLNSTPGKNFTIQLFSNPSGEDEGKTFKVQKRVTTDGAGNASFTVTLKGAKKIPVGDLVTATATNESTGDTSEFSAALPVN